ncbi:hypothetical protein ILP92_05445 [Maribius pontilimi]|uniref:Uncharacterized protein n=1 Tax=Palleronia pontilimi TaxID=1964209 RepID=A0A934IAR2_9RHOB|nr:hypothetical protein [Palleronia pontilimi]MBJ3762186.1 hypothetical protein [Palleronia pontilimi]
MICRILIPAALAFALPALADPARIEGAKAERSGDGWTVSVTLRHADTGWEDYADGWRVELADGTVLASRVLAHPHVTEQPFTRAKRGVAIPEGVDTVMIRARTRPGGWSDETLSLSLR